MSQPANKPTVLVTGSAGLVGRFLVPALLAAGYPVRVFLKEAHVAKEQAEAGCEAIVGDITDKSLCERAVSGIDVIFHLAALLRGSTKMYQAVNFGATKNLVEASAPQTQFIFLSYLPSHPDASNEYLRSKGQAEKAVKDSGRPYTIFKSSLIYGPGSELSRVIKTLVDLPFVPLPGSGKTKLQPIFVEDIISCLMQCMDEHHRNKTYCVAGPTALEDRELLNLSARLLNKRRIQIPVPIPFAMIGAAMWEFFTPAAPATLNEVMLSKYPAVCDISIVRKIFQEPKTPLEEGLRRSLLS